VARSGLVVVVTLLLVSSTVRAGVQVGPGVPFEAAELDRSLIARGVRDEVVVDSDGPGALRVATRAGTFRVLVGDRRGASAARIVALHLVAVALPAAPPPTVQRPAPVVAAARTRWAMATTTGVGRGAEPADPVLGRLGLALRARRGPWRWSTGVAWLHGGAQRESGARFAGSDLVLAYGSVGLGTEQAEVAVGPLLGGYRVDAGTASGWTSGLTAGGRVALVRAGRWRVLGNVDVDILQRRVVARVDGAPFAATPRVAASAGVALEWELAP
jgi:hypothetical protein